MPFIVLWDIYKIDRKWIENADNGQSNLFKEWSNICKGENLWKTQLKKSVLENVWMLLEVIENVLNDFKSNVLPLENSTSVPTPNLTPKPTPNPSVVYTPKQTRMQSRIRKIKKYLHLNQIKILRMKLQTTKKT